MAAALVVGVSAREAQNRRCPDNDSTGSVARPARTIRPCRAACPRVIRSSCSSLGGGGPFSDERQGSFFCCSSTFRRSRSTEIIGCWRSIASAALSSSPAQSSRPCRSHHANNCRCARCRWREWRTSSVHSPHAGRDKRTRRRPHEFASPDRARSPSNSRRCALDLAFDDPTVPEQQDPRFLHRLLGHGGRRLGPVSGGSEE